MDERRVRSLLAELARRLGDRSILWRGADLSGSDLDLLALPGAGDELEDVLKSFGLSPAPGDAGHVFWSAPDGQVLPVDVLPSSEWPAYYPSLGGVLRRMSRRESLPPLASDEDRLLMLAAEALAGRPLEKIARRARGLLEAPGARDRLRSVAADEGLVELGELIEDADRLAALERRGRLSYARALPIALRSAAARAALRARLGGRLGGVLPRPFPRIRPGSAGRDGGRALLIALSGMDGSGKSTAAEAARRRLEAAGLTVDYAWARLASQGDLLTRIATPVKRVLRYRGRVADPVAARAPGTETPKDLPQAGERRRVVAWVWVLLVAALNAHAYRRTARRARSGLSLICDRWVTDSLVDLNLRYGRHRAAEAVLRRAVPRPDLAILLELDAATAARRKPGDQDESILAKMERLYAEAAAEDRGLVSVDSRRPREEVEERIAQLVDELLTARGILESTTA